MNIKERFLLVAIMLVALAGKSAACFYYEADEDYYNLFAQEIMNDPRYKPFLLTYDSRFYPTEVVRNGNIEEWQNYLGLSYDDTHYLVFQASRDNIQKLIKNRPVVDAKLSFATPEFVKKHKQALLYLAYSKYLEPYMCIVPSADNELGAWSFGDEERHNAGELDYSQVKTVLAKSWAAETDKELKLRYGYQLVRLAHYTRRYEEAVQLFDSYVEPLKMRSEMYYYALSQKAGALRGMGEIEKSNRNFIHVFANSIDLKENAYTSMTLGWENEISFNDFVAGAADENERNDIYLMMGYSDFNNPVNEIVKIVANSPDAIQAKVLMVRAINKIERSLLEAWRSESDLTDSRYPFWNNYMEENLRPFFNQTLSVCDKQAVKAADKNFWNLALSYMHFLNKDFDKASGALGKVKSDDALYKTMLRNLTVYIDICRQPRMTADVENYLFAQYGDVITANGGWLYDNGYCFNNFYSPTFVDQVLANRYSLQGENAKSYLVMNHLTNIENRPSDKLLNEIQSFLGKKNKTPLEAYLVSKGTTDMADPNNYIAYVKGILRLTDGDFKASKPFFDKQTRLKVSKRIFGHNIRVWYSGKEMVIMRNDYISEFPFIHDNMTEADVTDALMQLQSIGNKGGGDYSAKANYLIANFFYNVSATGYYRHYLRFDRNNGWNSEKFDFDVDAYKNTLPLSVEYLKKAKKGATDNELKAHIVFAQAKNAQQELERRGNVRSSSVARPLFDELGQYRQTKYYGEVSSNCLYFKDYHTSSDRK